jgi:2-dehydro-3-deoxyglucarate aldolase/4-hydroxy-2-oxoheptanedioate aldolase
MIAARSGGTTTWVRVPWNDPVLAKPVLDMGADGIIFPMVRTVEEANLAVAACKYPPKGVRGYGPLRALDYGAITQTEYVHNTYKDCHVVVQLEHVDAVKNLREIADVDGIDAFIIGPNDLSASIGLIGEINHPKVKELYEEIAKVLTEKKKPFGVSIGYNEENIKYWIKLGANMIFCGTDVDYVYRGAKNTLDGFKKIQGV